MKRNRSPLVLIFALTLTSLAAQTAIPEPPKKKPAAGEEESEASGPAFAFICFNDSKPANEKAWKKALTKWFGLKSAEAIGDFELDLGKAKGDEKNAWSTSFSIDGQTFMIANIDAPVPKPDIEYAVGNTLGWPDAGKTMGKHKAHAIVMSMGEYDTPAGKALALSRVIAAASSIHNTAGIYWGHATVVHSPQNFRKLTDGASEKMEDVPTPLWVGFLREAGDKEDTVNFYTRGLAEFGAKELEVLNSKRKPSEIYKLLMGLSTYLIVKGDVIKDGDTVGGTDDDKIKTQWVDSHIDLEGKVIRIDY